MSQPRLPPYLIARGRTRPTNSIAIETMVECVVPVAESSRPRFESKAVLDMATNAVSVAEVAARLCLPLGATLVLVSDLLDSGHVFAHDTSEQSEASDLDIMTRIISRVRDL